MRDEKRPCGSAAGPLLCIGWGRSCEEVKKCRLRLGKMTKIVSVIERQMSGVWAAERRVCA